jgi:hypothetical protein
MFDLAGNTPSLNVDQSQTATATTFGLKSSVGLYVDGV